MLNHYIIKKIKKIISPVRPYAILIIYFIGAGYFLSWGVWYMVAWLILFVVIRLLLGWGQLLPSIRYVETLLYGKPLEKEYWSKGEKKVLRKPRMGKKEK